MIDFRSDTITKPTKEMLEAMFHAEVGDDVFMDDPSVNHLQEKAADLFGMEDALFCPSGTMTNQIGMRISTRPQDEIICHKYSHVYLYEGGGMMYNSMVSPKLLEGNRGRITAEQIAENINADDIHFPKTAMVVLENTMNKGGGSTYDLNEIAKIKATCRENNLTLHLDGARLFNAIVANAEDPKTYGELFDSISVCFSKGLGAPVGSVLLASKEKIKDARRVRKALGGGMRQAGYLAAACTYALDHHVGRLSEDHSAAKELGQILATCDVIEEVYPIETNIVIAKVEADKGDQWFLSKLEEQGILGVSFGKNLVRFVTHLDLPAGFLDDFSKAMKAIS